jgi:hypothetical protein
MSPEVKDHRQELYAMPVDEVIAILRSSSDDRVGATFTRRDRRARRRILADRAPEPDLVLLTSNR